MNGNQDCIVKEDILVVDDNPDNLRLLSKMLNKNGYRVRTAMNGQMALTAAQNVAPDLILLDIMMPDIDGYEVCENLKADPNTAEIPVIFLSALTDTFDKVKAFTAGGIDYIVKPFQMAEVLARVQNHLALRAAEIEKKQLNYQLEERVKERTSQLEAANYELKREIGERKLLEAQLLKMALHDSLTDLPNRVLFMERLIEALNCAKAQQDYQFAVLFLDCDRFKFINDSLGHPVGDELLIALARRLELYLNPGATLARLGGDEFAILIVDIETIATATQLANRILQALTVSFQLQRYEVFINATIGIALGNCHYDQPEHLLRDADTAMYRAKTLGKGQYQIFDPGMHQAALQILQLENDLRRAVKQQEFMVHYQPIIDLKTGIIFGFEALVRWHHPQQGLIPPSVFIPIAEETGLIKAIGKLVLGEACRQLQLWHQEKITYYPLTMSVNLSVKQFAQPDLIEQIDEILAQTQLNPEFLKLEITESVIMENDKSAAITLQKLRDRHIQLSIDDFGTGYSSLSYLHFFPVENLKIDRSFVQILNGDPENLGLIPAIISISQALGMKAIAEGVETREQLAQLRSLNCHFGQGYLFSKPLNAKQARNLIVSAPRW
jgi:diguanylate cyclase (GGDEF)-like protein